VLGNLEVCEPGSNHSVEIRWRILSNNPQITLVFEAGLSTFWEVAKNSLPGLGGVPFARFLANGGVVDQLMRSHLIEERCASIYKVALHHSVPTRLRH
jgi:hypothetical protein